MQDLKKLTDEQLEEVIAFAKKELQERADTRREEAIAEITRRAKEVGIHVSIKGKKKNGKHLKAGEKFQHPDDPAKTWTVGNGRPPNWLSGAKKIA